ncbi:MAG: SBBP repeat-containing protein [Deltaproteobacteria bacterium]|nr:SBBP repeat-containing protein [Deltaproteobacteria bacterium]
MVAGAVFGAATLSYAQDLFWAKKAGGGSTDEGHGIAVDGSGNSYVTGRFQGTSVFGPGEAGQTSLVSGGLVDIFVAKYDSDGLLVWVKQAGGEGTNEGRALTVDSSGNSYVTGFFQNTATFGAGEGNETTLVAQGGNADIFVAKYDSSGLLQWVKQAGSGNGVVGVGSSTEQGLGIGIDASNVYVTGFFQSTNAVFGPGEAGEVTLSVPGGGREIFLAKFSASDGTFAWVKNAGGVGTDEGHAIAVDSSGNSYITGVFALTATFDAATVTSAASGDVFVAKYNTSGTLVWVKRAGGGSDDEGNGIAIDGSGKSYVTGRFTGTNVTFGPGEGNQTLLSAGHGNDIDIFVAGYNADGTLAWAKRAGGLSGGSGPSPDEGFGIATDSDGNSYVTGFFNNTATFGPGAGQSVVAASTTNEDIFLATYTSSGNLIWVRRAGGTSRDESYAVAVRNREAHITGRIQGQAASSAVFGLGETNETTLSASAVDIFVAKYKAPVCGDSALGVGETCDEGAANGMPGSCCSSECTLVTEGTVCREGIGLCDADETCNGISGTCPADVLATAGTVCRPGVDACDAAETCSGASADCPSDSFAEAGTACGGSAAACDALDTCDGSGTCVDNIDPADTVCLSGTGVCDPNDTCDGSSKTCAPVVATAGTACGGSDAACDALDTCNGSGSCTDNVDPAGTVCLTGTGTCDPNDTCDGTGKACAPTFAETGTACGGSDVACDALDTCNGSGSCTDNVDTAGTVCLTGTGICDPNDTCDGASAACAPTFAETGTACGGSDVACDALDTCNGGGTCVDNIDSADVVCRASAGTCDPAEHCTGSSTICPIDVASAPGAVCRPAVSSCDHEEVCDGSGVCPPDIVEPPTTVCRAGSGDCTDTPEFCNGKTGDCPPDLPVVATFGCQIGSNPTPVLCQGTSKKDLIIGTNGPDVIFGGGGNDEIHGLKGDDIICGEDGNDILVGDLGNDILLGGNGNDILRGNGADSPLVDEEDNNRLFGGEGNDTLIGGEGADRLEGENGNDKLLSHGGNDLLFGGAGKDNLNGGDGDDELDGGTEVDKLDGGPGIDKCKNGESPAFKNCELVLP